MGLGSVMLRFIFARLIPCLVVGCAILVGWLNLAPIPEGKLFATIFPVLKGVWPPTIVGHGKMTGTPPVPLDMMPQPRPVNERFLDLPGGYQMPQNGLGMCCRPSAYDDVLVERTVLWYLLMGGRHIDTAHIYLNHKAVGKGIKEAIRRGVPREEIFVTTKLFPSYYGRNTTLQIVPTFLDELGLEYVDLILMHMPSRIPGMDWLSSECSQRSLSRYDCIKETYQALSELREQRFMRNIGVSNFPTKILKEIQSLENGAPIANNQINFNPWIHESWLDTVEFCKQNGITITGYFTLGSSLQHHEAQTIAVLTNLATKYGKSVAQIMLRWAIQMDTVVIPGTGNPDHMRENLAIYDFELSEEDMTAIGNLRTAEEVKKFISTTTHYIE